MAFNRGKLTDDSVKVQVSLRLPQALVEHVVRLAAEETLRTGKRVSPSQIYLYAIKQYVEQNSQKGD